MQPSAFLGELVVVALKAEHLKHQSARKQDPFCIFSVNGIAKKTKADNGGNTYPVWDDQVNIPISQNAQRLRVEIFDRDPSPVNLMADGWIDLARVIHEKEQDGYFPLYYRGQPGGEIYLELTFYPSRPSQERPNQPIRYPAHKTHVQPPPIVPLQKPLPPRPGSPNSRPAPQFSRPPPIYNSPVHLVAPNSNYSPYTNLTPNTYPTPYSAPYHAPYPSNVRPPPFFLAPPRPNYFPYPRPNPLSPQMSPPPSHFQPRPVQGGYPPVSMYPRPNPPY